MREVQPSISGTAKYKTKQAYNGIWKQRNKLMLWS